MPSYRVSRNRRKHKYRILNTTNSRHLTINPRVLLCQPLNRVWLCRYACCDWSYLWRGRGSMSDGRLCRGFRFYMRRHVNLFAFYQPIAHKHIMHGARCLCPHAKPMEHALLLKSVLMCPWVVPTNCFACIPAPGAIALIGHHHPIGGLVFLTRSL